MPAKMKYTELAYTFLNVCEKIHQFLSSIKRCKQKKIDSFFSAWRWIFQLSVCLSVHMCMCACWSACHLTSIWFEGSDFSICPEPNLLNHQPWPSLTDNVSICNKNWIPVGAKCWSQWVWKHDFVQHTDDTDQLAGHDFLLVFRSGFRSTTVCVGGTFVEL